MDIDEYKRRVIELFKSGEASSKHWDEMASAVLEVSESNRFSTVEYIDRYIDHEK